jgi:ribosomal protein S18 acetylase RimI-like enzyme
MLIDIQEIGVDALSQYAQIPIAFRVESVLRVCLVEGGIGGMRLCEERLARPYVKDYDAHGGGPEREFTRFDVSNWCFLLARERTRPVAGAAVALNTPGAGMLGSRQDLAVLWDIRVHPDLRGHGIGTRVFRRATAWSREQGCRQLKMETQNVNVRACRFYAKQGCQLGEINRYAYVGHPEVEHEVMLVWYLGL